MLPNHHEDIKHCLHLHLLPRWLFKNHSMWFHGMFPHIRMNQTSEKSPMFGSVAITLSPQLSTHLYTQPFTESLIQLTYPLPNTFSENWLPF